MTQKSRKLAIKNLNAPRRSAALTSKVGRSFPMLLEMQNSLTRTRESHRENGRGQNTCRRRVFRVEKTSTFVRCHRAESS